MMDLQHLDRHCLGADKFRNSYTSPLATMVPETYGPPNPSPLETMAERFGKMVRGFQLNSVSPVPVSHVANGANSQVTRLEQSVVSNDKSENNGAISIPLVFCGQPFNYLQSKIRKTVYLTEDVVSNPHDLTAYRVQKSEVYDGLFYTPCLCHSRPMACSSPLNQNSGHPNELINISSECFPTWKQGLQEPCVFGIGESEEILNSRNEKFSNFTEPESYSLSRKLSYPGPLVGSDSSSSPITYSSNGSCQLKTEELSVPPQLRQPQQRLSPTNYSCFGLIHPPVERSSYREHEREPVALGGAMFESTKPVSLDADGKTTTTASSQPCEYAHGLPWDGQNVASEGDSCGFCLVDPTDTATKPPFSYITLIVSAMGSKPSKQITLNEIYAWIMSTFAYYRKNTRRWQNSIRHALSFNDCFIKIPRPTGEAGKGSYWTVHPRAVDMFENGSSMRRNRKFVDESRIRGSANHGRMGPRAKARRSTQRRHENVKNKARIHQSFDPNSNALDDKCHSVRDTENLFGFDQTCSGDWSASQWHFSRQSNGSNWIQQQQLQQQQHRTDRLHETEPSPSLTFPDPQDLPYQQSGVVGPYYQSADADRCPAAVLRPTGSLSPCCFGPSEPQTQKSLSYIDRICHMPTEWSNYESQAQSLSTS